MVRPCGRETIPQASGRDREAGGKIAAARKQRGITVQELALEAEIDRRTIQRIEKGNAVVTIHTLLSISEALKVDPRELLQFIDDEKMGGKYKV